MLTTACPLCRKRYPPAFLPLHAASCSLPSRRPSIKLPPAGLISKPPPRRRSPTEPGTSSSSTKLPPPPSSPKPAPKPARKPRPLLLKPRYSLSLPAHPFAAGAPGFHVFPALFAHLQASLLSAVHAAPPLWTDLRVRRSKAYGPPYSLRARRFLFRHRPVPLPAYAVRHVLPVVRARTLPALRRWHPNQMMVGLYGRAGSILPHNDCEGARVGTAVVGVCLGGAARMTLILRARFSGVGKDVRREVWLPGGCVYVMTGDALRVWEHAIFPGAVQDERCSLTFRDVSPLPGEEGAERDEAEEANEVGEDGGTRKKRRT